MGLKQILYGAAGTGIGLAVLCGGCDNPNANMAAGVLGAGAQTSPYSSPQNRMLGAMLSSGAQLKNETNAANTIAKGKNSTNEKYEDEIVFLEGYKVKCHILEKTDEELVYRPEGNNEVCKASINELKYWIDR